MQVGLAMQSITPALPINLSGFAKERKAESVYDDLYVKVLIVQHENSFYGAISYDLVGFDSLLMKLLKQKMKLLALDIHHFVVAATHTHSACGGCVNSSEGILKGTEYIFMPMDKTLIEKIVDQTILALKAALADLKEAKIYTAKDILHGIGSNRNDPNLKGNDDIMAVFIEQEKGRKVMLVNFACHPTVLNQDNVKISADFPGSLHTYACEQGYYYSMFLNGSCGDISTRFTRVSSGYKEVERYGKLLINKLMEMRQNAVCLSSLMIDILHLDIDLKLKKADSVAVAEKKYNRYQLEAEKAKRNGISGGELRIIQSHKEGAAANLAYAKNALNAETYAIPIHLFKVNNDVFICVSGELFSELSNKMQNDHLHFIGYAGGYHGYFANEYAYEHGYYEALSSPFEKGQSEYMMKMIKDKIALLRGGKSLYENS